MNTLSFLALGDSYTIGESVPEPETWPFQLCQQMRSRGLAIERPQVIAATGWTCTELDAAIDESKSRKQLAQRYNLAALSIGVNNQYRGGSSADFAAEFRTLLDRAISLSDVNRCFVLSIPDWGSTPFAAEQGRDPVAVSNDIDHFNSIKRKLCQAAGVSFFDVTQLGRRLPELLANDRLHPSGAQYAWWVAEILEGVLALLRHRHRSE